MDPQGDATGYVRADVGGHGALGALGCHDEVYSEGTADGGNPHQFGQGGRGLVDQHPEFIDDDDQMRQQRPGRMSRFVSCEIGGPKRGEEFLPAANFRAQGDESAGYFVGVEIGEETDAVGQTGQGPQTGAALEIYEQQIDSARRMGGRQRSGQGPEEFRLA